MSNVEDAAQWMWSELQRNGSLNQYSAVTHIVEHFGKELAYTNENGNPAIDKAVLKRFKQLHGGRAEWFKPPDGYWSLRK